MKKPTLVLATVLLAQWAHAQVTVSESSSDDRKNLNVTIYNDNRALVQETRSVKFTQGIQTLNYKDVSSSIEPSTLIVKSNSDLKILEQNYEYDLISPQKLLEKYVGQKVTLVQDENPSQAAKSTEATLLSTNGSPVFEIDGKIQIGLPGRVVLPKLPENLAARPSLKWLVQNAKSGVQNLDVSYLSHGMSWRADYVLLLDSTDKSGDLTAWINLTNNSGTHFRDAKLKLVAGTVNQVNDAVGYGSGARSLKMAMPPMAMEMAEEKTFDEYHLYTLPRPVSLADQQNKQIQLFPTTALRTEKVYLAKPAYFSLNNNDQGMQKTPVGVHLQFQTGKENHLDLPLPAGVIRVYKNDSDGSQIFVGEDRIDHTPKNESVQIKTGEAFDLVCENRQLSYSRIDKNTHETSWEVKVRNHKTETVTVNFDQPVFGDWSVTKGPKPQKMNANTIRFPISVKADGETVLNYTIRVKE